MDARRQDLANSLGLLALRAGAGGFMLTHGWGKVQMLLEGAEFGDPIGLGSTASLVLVTTAEFVCSLLVVLGAATRLASIPPVIAMGVAAFKVHGADPWTMTEAGRLFMAGESKSWASKEPALLFLTAFLALFFCGAGRFSVDGLWRARRAAGAP
jgi:putative oxidoreductase